MRFEYQPHIPASLRFASAVLALSCLMPNFAVAESPEPLAPHTITVIASTVPANGDINPYGIFVGITLGKSDGTVGTTSIS